MDSTELRERMKKKEVNKNVIRKKLISNKHLAAGGTFCLHLFCVDLNLNIIVSAAFYALKM